MTFNVGDKVRCITNSGVTNYLHNGEEYEVTRTSYSVVALKGVFGSFQDWRFRLVPNDKPKYRSPIETIPAKRVLKAGVHGVLEINQGIESGTIRLRLNVPSGHHYVSLSVEGLDELIFTLTQVREFLKDG